MDFAVTCPLQHGFVQDAANRTLAAATDYKAHKLADRHTAQRCAELGFQLTPMIAETLGGWGPMAQDVFRAIAKATAEAKGTDVSVATCQLYEGLGVRLQRSNARAILSRITAATAAGRNNSALAIAAALETAA